VVDDLHDADQPSLQMLRFIALTIKNAPPDFGYRCGAGHQTIPRYHHMAEVFILSAGWVMRESSGLECFGSR